MKKSAVILALVMLTACAGGVDSETALLQHGYSPDYVAGYHDGCPSGEKAAGEFTRQERRDETAYAANGDYKSGWDYGFVTCAESERTRLEIARAIGESIAASGAAAHGADGIDTKKMLEGIDTSAIKAAGW